MVTLSAMVHPVIKTVIATTFRPFKELDPADICTVPDRTLTLDEVADHCSHDDCWIVIADRVYNVTSYIAEHPGGTEIIMEHAGRDATFAFDGKGHTKEAVRTLHQYCIGILIPEERIYSRTIYEQQYITKSNEPPK